MTLLFRDATEAIRLALCDMLRKSERLHPFVIVKVGEHFIQFVGSRNRGILLDIPVGEVPDHKIEAAHILGAPVRWGTVEMAGWSFQKRFGEDAAGAAGETVELFRELFDAEDDDVVLITITDSTVTGPPEGAKR